MHFTHRWVSAAIALSCIASVDANAQPDRTPPSLPVVADAPAQPLRAQVRNLVDTLNSSVLPCPAAAQADLNAASQIKDDAQQVAAIQKALDANCLFAVQINPESRVSVAQGPAKPQLVQRDWRLYLIKIYNQAGVTAPLHISSPNQIAEKDSSTAEVRDRWLDLKLYSQQDWINYQGNDPVAPTARGLSGLPVEYRILQVFSKDAGMLSAKILVDVGQGTQDLGFRNEANILFQCIPTLDLTLHVQDEHSKPSMAMFRIRDASGRTYPSAVGRVAPDFFFQPQVYRADGETVRLPAGDYTIQYGRGPEYLTKTTTLTVDARRHAFSVKLDRWIDPSSLGWWSGDHHIHAAGLQALHQPDRRRAGIRYAALLSRRRPEGRLQLDLGTLFRLSKAVLYRQNR